MTPDSMTPLERLRRARRQLQVAWVLLVLATVLGITLLVVVV